MKGFSVTLRALLPVSPCAKIWNHSHYFQRYCFLYLVKQTLFFSLYILCNIHLHSYRIHLNKKFVVHTLYYFLFNVMKNSDNAFVLK